MDFSTGSLLTSLAVSSVGFVAFSYGKKMQRPPQILTGILLMVFPYFAPGTGWMLAGATGLLVLLWLALKSGL